MEAVDIRAAVAVGTATAGKKAFAKDAACGRRFCLVAAYRETQGPSTARDDPLARIISLRLIA